MGILRRGGGQSTTPNKSTEFQKAQPNQGYVGWPGARKFVPIQRPPSARMLAVGSTCRRHFVVVALSISQSDSCTDICKTH